MTVISAFIVFQTDLRWRLFHEFNCVSGILTAIGWFATGFDKRIDRIGNQKQQTPSQGTFEKVRPDQQERLELLLDKNQRGTVAEEEQNELSLLQKSADRIMLRKARAAVLLRFRGERLPTLTELRHLTGDE